MNLEDYRITYNLADWERIATQSGEICAPIGAVRAVNALCDEVESLRKQQAAPVAWMTYDFDGKQMLWNDYAEACVYCDDDEKPIPLYAAPPTCFSAADMADAQAKAAQVEREECARACDMLAHEWRGANSQLVACAKAIRSRNGA